MEKKVWGWHLSLDASGCDLGKMTNYDNVYNFTKQLVKDIDMVAYGEPQIINFGTGDKAGFTMVQLIETSNICAHFADDLRTVFLDVFSCKEYSRDIVISLVHQYFSPTETHTSFIERVAYA